MSIVEELAAQVRATGDELPVELLTRALDRFRQASERLRWVRQESADPMGVPELSAATEHTESANHALLVAREQLAEYLTAIGMARDGAPAPPPQRRPEDQRRQRQQDGHAPPNARQEHRAGGSVRRWWPDRVAELTGEDVPDDDSAVPTDRPADRATDPEDLLRRVAVGVRSGDRGRVNAELRGVDTDVGLGLAAIAPPMLRQLATELIGHPPRAQDMPRLRRELDGVRGLLPGLPPPVLDTVLSRVCRMPPPKEPPERQPHPADPAVAAGVLTGLLLHRLGHDAPPPVASTPETHG